MIKFSELKKQLDEVKLTDQDDPYNRNVPSAEKLFADIHTAIKIDYPLGQDHIFNGDTKEIMEELETRCEFLDESKVTELRKKAKELVVKLRKAKVKDETIIKKLKDAGIPEDTILSIMGDD